MNSKGYIPLFYWSSVLFERKKEENYGDLLSKYIVEKVSGRSVKFFNAPKQKKKWFKKKHLMAIGSIMSYATKKSLVWGSGIISQTDTFGPASFYAVRGPKTRERIIELGYSCPEVYGDPAILLPKYYKPQVDKKYSYGIIPHYIDYEDAVSIYRDNNDVKVIDLIGSDVEKITLEILSCERTISSSLHGLIVSHAYGIPSVWVKFSDRLSGDDVKFQDYILSVGIEPYAAVTITMDSKELDTYHYQVPLEEKIDSIQNDLIKSFPKQN